MKIHIKDIAILSMLGAVLFALQVALSFLPNIGLTSLLIILYTLVFRRKAIYIIYMFVLLEGAVYGYGIWFVNYLYVWAILAGITALFRERRSPLFWAMVAGGFGLSFGALCAIPYFFLGGVSGAVAYWIQGIPFDLLHAAGNFAATLLLFHPLHRTLLRLKGEKS